MAKKIPLSPENIKKNIHTVQRWMEQQEIDALYVSSFDIWLNEYVPLENCPRFYITGFSGSVAEVLLERGKRVRLYVDGRYHQQADEEVDADLIEVVKCAYGVSNKEKLKEDLACAQGPKLGLFASRTFLADKLYFASAVSEVVSFSEEQLKGLIPLVTPQENCRVEYVDISLTGKSTEDKLKEVLAADAGLFISQMDSLSWVINGRGYQLPYQSAVVAKGLATRDQVRLIANGYAEDIPKLDLAKVSYDPQHISVTDFTTLTSLYGDALVEKPGGIQQQHAFKNPGEIKAMEKSFAKGDRGIFKTMQWVRECYTNKKTFSELDFYHCAEKNYRETGAKSQSFHTIAGIGANSAIIHFANPSAAVVVKEGDLLLLDSGGYWQSGFATDTTRVGVYAEQGTAEQKKLYTLVLQGLLRAQNAVFQKGTLGKEIDALARGPLQAAGLDYAHGTGHGVGINVHEGGYSLTPQSQIPLHAGLVGSIEPGVYIPGLGGIRLENIVAVEELPDDPNRLRFRPLVFIGFEPKLIDYNLLNGQEQAWLANYEKTCEVHGTSFL